MADHLTIGVWNVQWAKPGSKRGVLVASALEALSPCLVCVTEGYRDLFPARGSVIASSADYGYIADKNRRKVLLWSASQWREVDDVGSPNMPSGRFISGITATAIGPTRVVGVCIPWSAAHVSTGRKDRRRWEDHLQFLSGLATVVVNLARDVPTVLLGDFNQPIPIARQPLAVYSALQSALGRTLKVHTGRVAQSAPALIDHIATNDRLKCVSLAVRMPQNAIGRNLSDHPAITMTCCRAAQIR